MASLLAFFELLALVFLQFGVCHDEKRNMNQRA